MPPNICGLRHRHQHRIGRLSRWLSSHARSFLQVDPESRALGPTCPLLAEAPCAATTGPSARSPVSAAALIPGARLDKSLGRLYASAREGAQRSWAHQQDSTAGATTRTYGGHRTE